MKASSDVPLLGPRLGLIVALVGASIFVSKMDVPKLSGFWLNCGLVYSHDLIPACLSAVAD